MRKEELFEKYWGKTEVVREYHQMLFTFGDMILPYVFVAEHTNYVDRTLVQKGVVNIKKPNILLPGYHPNITFKEGFEDFQDIPHHMALIIRSLGLPYSEISNKQVAQKEVEYGSLQDVIDKYDNTLEQQEDSDTGLIKGMADGVDISLMRYSIGLMIKSAPENVREFFEHIKRQRGEPIRPNDTITDEDIRRLFG